MFQRMLLVGALTIALSGCVSAVDRERVVVQKRTDISTVIEKYREPVQGTVCIQLYKNNMNDPGSFQLASPLIYDEITTNTWYGVGWDNHNPRRVVYSARVRGKNAYGGLVLGMMNCHIGVNPDGSVSVLRALSG